MGRPHVPGVGRRCVVLGVIALAGWGCGGGAVKHNTRITIESTPEPGAKVLINDNPYGETPATVDGLAPGAVLVQLDKDGYHTELETVRVPDEGAETFVFPMRLKVGQVAVNSTPPGAEVRVDGTTLLGLTPLRGAEVRAGEHVFELRKEHYQPLGFKLVVEPEYQYTKAFNLSPEQSRLEVYSSPTGANVWLNNQIQAQKTPARFALLPGVYTVSVHITGHIASEEVVTLGPDSTRKLDLKLVEGNVPPGMVLVPAGEFQFGVDNQAPDERPKRTVYLDVFYIDKYEATNADFKAVFKEHRFPAGQENFAVTKVSWEQASAYALAVKKRLPTEMEWEKATRGTDGREYPWGGLFDPEMANTGATPGAKIREVGQYRAGASPYNCMDMAGNAYEWTASWYAAYPGNRVVVKEYGQLYRVLRGGSFQGSPYEARCAARRYDLPDRARSDYGFRCALSAESGEGQGGRSQ